MPCPNFHPAASTYLSFVRVIMPHVLMYIITNGREVPHQNTAAVGFRGFGVMQNPAAPRSGMADTTVAVHMANGKTVLSTGIQIRSVIDLSGFRRVVIGEPGDIEGGLLFQLFPRLPWPVPRLSACFES